MSDQPVSTTPPVVNFQFDNPVTDQHLPQFMAALESGSKKAAEGVVKGINGGAMDEFIFDEMVGKSKKYLLDKGGWNLHNYTHDDRYRRAIGLTNDDLQKAISIGDIPNIYLIRLAKLMIPLYAGLTQRIPTVRPPTGGSAANWRTEIGTSNFNVASAMATSEGSPGLAISESFNTFTSPFRRLAVQDKVYLEAVYGSQGFDDPLQVAVLRALTLMLRTKENKVLGDNAGSLAAPGTITATASSLGGSLGSATAGSIYVTALSHLGYQYYLATGSTGSVGETTAASTTQAAAGGSGAATCSFTATWAAVPGAVAYAVYCGSTTGSANMFLNQVVTIGSVVIKSIKTTGVFPLADTTVGATSYEGIIPWCEKQTLYSNTASTNRTLTDQSAGSLTTYAGGITEFDTLLASLWTYWQVAPSLIVCSPNSVKHVTKQILSTSAVSAYRIEVGQERGTMTGGAFVTGYVNKFAPFGDGLPRIIDIMAHPYIADGTFLFLTERISYPIARENRGFVLEQLIPYTYFPLAQVDVSYPFSMLCSETLECFHWPAQSAIYNVNVAL